MCCLVTRNIVLTSRPLTLHLIYWDIRTQWSVSCPVPRITACRVFVCQRHQPMDTMWHRHYSIYPKESGTAFLENMEQFGSENVRDRRHWNRIHHRCRHERCRIYEHELFHPTRGSSIPALLNLCWLEKGIEGCRCQWAQESELQIWGCEDGWRVGEKVGMTDKMIGCRTVKGLRDVNTR